MNQENSDWKNTVFAEWKGARTVLSERYSYSYWFEEKHNGTHMLFDHQVDPDENKNVAGNTEYESVVIEHRAMIDSLYTTFDID